MSQVYDILIVGGGLTGQTLALSLSGQGFKVCVLDREKVQRRLDAEFDGRTTAIAHASSKLYESLGVWDLKALNGNPIDDIRVADRSSHFFVHYDADEIGGEPLGYIIENQKLTAVMMDKIEELQASADSCLIYRGGEEVLSLIPGDPYMTVELKSKELLKARLVLAADGKFSFCRQFMGIKTQSYDYHQKAISCTIKITKSHHNVAIEEFCPSGPFALLPMSEQRMSVVWALKQEIVDDYLSLPSDAFLEILKQKISMDLGDVSLVGKVASYPLSLSFAERYIESRFALVGDAAHGIHPIAGQGFNLGVRDIAALTEILVRARRDGQDIGSLMSLEDYQKWRRFDNMLMIQVTDGLTKLFGNTHPLLRLARNLGFGIVGRVPAIRKFFMMHALGTVGDLPALLKGQPV